MVLPHAMVYAIIVAAVKTVTGGDGVVTRPSCRRLGVVATVRNEITRRMGRIGHRVLRATHKTMMTTTKKFLLAKNCPLVSSIYWSSVPVSEQLEFFQNKTDRLLIISNTLPISIVKAFHQMV